MGRKTFRKLTAICLISTLVPQATALTAAVDAAQAFGLLPRQTSTCATANYSPCNKAGIPSNFCCPSDSICTVFNNNKSVVCCPNGRDCSTISPLTCDLVAQNATLHPSNQLHSTDLTGSLETCGSNTCCPKGFGCTNGQCVMKAVAAASSSSTQAAATSKSASASASSTSKPSATTSKSASSASQTAAAAPTSDNTKITPVGFIAGFFPGMLLGVLLTVAVIICIGRRRAKREEKDGDFGSVAATVSDPIYQDSNGFRTDFLRRESATKNYNNGNNRTSRVRSLFSSSRSPTMTSSPESYSKTVLPKTPPNNRRVGEMQREPSMESIKIYSPANGQLQRPQTTFTDMMADAGFREGDRYLGSPGRVDPRARGAH
ncbi:MAG: hypothetical protein LQ350_004530 [Teloschistes chrysophthalmus]|nr:MAG: hypothetical protein LQ350_004530 [Niorma chrysophthalma]